VLRWTGPRACCRGAGERCGAVPNPRCCCRKPHRNRSRCRHWTSSHAVTVPTGPQLELRFFAGTPALLLLLDTRPVFALLAPHSEVCTAGPPVLLCCSCISTLDPHSIVTLLSVGPSVRLSSHWTPVGTHRFSSLGAWCLACWTPSFAVPVSSHCFAHPGPQLAVTRLTHQYCVTSLIRYFGTGVPLLWSLGPACRYCWHSIGCPPAVVLATLLVGPGHGASLTSVTVVVTATAQPRNLDPNLQSSFTTGGGGPHTVSSSRSAKCL
jgi:hypothetical protein